MDTNIMTISKDKQYKTRDGRSARILATDICGDLPIAAAIRSDDGLYEGIYSYRAHGRIYSNRDSHLDLVEVKPTHTRWLVVQPEDGYPSKIEAQQSAREFMDVAVISVTFEEGEGLDG